MTELKSLLSKLERVKTTEMRPHPRNPRRGDVSTIAESLENNQQYRPIVIQRKTGYVIAGNHTYLAARKLGWSHLDVVYVDVNDKQARKIMLADNKTSDLGTYDDQLLAEIVSSLEGEIAGTGYSQEEVDALLEGVEQQFDGQSTDTYLPPENQDAEGEYLDPDDQEPPAPRIPTNREQYLEHRSEEQEQANLQRGAPTPDLSSQQEVDRYRVKAELQAAMEIREGEGYLGPDFWQIPQLRTDMLLDHVPDDFLGWGGPETLKAWGDDPDRWWLYNYSLGSTTNMPYERTVLCFFTYDDKFENWWDMPAYYLARMVSAGIDKAVVPDFSLYDFTPRVMHLNNIYRAQWMGRYFQENGLKVIPRFQFSDEESLRFCMLGIPVGAPLVICSAQNFKPTKEVQEATGLTERDMEERWAKVTDQAMVKLKPGKLLLYGNEKRLTRIMSDHPFSRSRAKVQIVPSFSDVRRRSGVFGRSEGLGGLSTAERSRIRDEAQEKAGGARQKRDPRDEMTEDDLYAETLGDEG